MQSLEFLLNPCKVLLLDMDTDCRQFLLLELLQGLPDEGVHVHHLLVRSKEIHLLDQSLAGGHSLDHALHAL